MYTGGTVLEFILDQPHRHASQKENSDTACPVSCERSEAASMDEPGQADRKESKGEQAGPSREPKLVRPAKQ